MGRTKSSSHTTTHPPATQTTASTPSTSTGLHTVASSSSLSSRDSVHEVKLKELLAELKVLMDDAQEERNRSEEKLVNIGKTHDKIRQDNKVTPYYRSKLKSLYTSAKQDGENEYDALKKVLDKIEEIKALRERAVIDKPKSLMRRGLKMSLLQKNAASLRLWIGKGSEDPPPLCGAIPPDTSYIAKASDKVAALVKSEEGEENWILAEVVSYNGVTNKYDVDDIDADEGENVRHTLSRRRVLPLPLWKANPETDSQAIFEPGALVLALYPQTTCFYRAVVHEVPKQANEEYLVLFEDSSYATGYSPPLHVSQRYVIHCKEDVKERRR